MNSLVKTHMLLIPHVAGCMTRFIDSWLDTVDH